MYSVRSESCQNTTQLQARTETFWTCTRSKEGAYNPYYYVFFTPGGSGSDALKPFWTCKRSKKVACKPWYNAFLVWAVQAWTHRTHPSHQRQNTPPAHGTCRGRREVPGKPKTYISCLLFPTIPSGRRSFVRNGRFALSARHSVTSLSVLKWLLPSTCLLQFSCTVFCPLAVRYKHPPTDARRRL